MVDDTKGVSAFGTYVPERSMQVLIRLSQLTPLGRGKLRRKVAGVLRARHDGPLDTSLFGLNARLELRRNSSEMKALLKPSLYSRTATELLDGLRSAETACVVDIGANAGVFSLLAASRMKAGHLIAVEPQDQLFQRLQVHLGELNPALLQRLTISLFNCAVGADVDTLALNVPEQLGQASLHALPGSAQHMVAVRPLLAVLKEAGVGRVDLLKIDIEGFEDKALIPFFRDAPESFWPEAILMEHCHQDRWKQDCLSFLVERGYVILSKGRTDTALTRARI